MDEVYILDALNLIFRSYYAIAPMTNNKGHTTSALYGFIRSVQKIIKEFSPNYLVAVFDGPDNTKSRTAVYSEYKMNRKEAPDDLYPQIEWAYHYCELAGIPAISIPGIEADDTMASISLWAKSQKAKSFICTSDKDLFQLVDDSIFVINIHKNNLFVDKEKVEEIYGVRPDQMLDFLAIMGDSADNIPGLPGFGPKTAALLLQQFGTLDAILKNPEKVSGKKKQQTLVEEKEKALLSKELATLHINADIPKTSSFYLLQSPDLEKLETFFQKNNFTSMLKGTLKELQKPQEEETFYLTIENKKDLQELIDTFSKEKEICIDTETTDLDPMKAKIVGNVPSSTIYRPREC